MNPKELKELAIKDAKCRLILDAAQNVFREKGIWNARMEDIAAIAGFSKPSLYNYYPDKEAIVISLAIREMRALSDKIDLVASRQGSFVECVEEIVRSILLQIADSFSMILDIAEYQRIASLTADMAKHTELVTRFRETATQIFKACTTLVEKGRTSGEIGSTLPADVMAQFLLSMTQSIQMNWKMQGKIDDIEVAVSQLLNFIKNGFAIKPYQK